MTRLQSLYNVYTSKVDECIEWQVDYGYQKFCKCLDKIFKKHLKLPISLSSIHDQNTIFIQISHIAKPHTHKSIFGSTQTINQLKKTA